MSNNYMKPLNGFENKSNEQPVVQTNETSNVTSNSIYMKPISNDVQRQDVPSAYQAQPSNVGDTNGIRYSFEIDHLTHTFDNGTKHQFKIFDNFSLKLEDKPNVSEVVSIMGGSGCGKSCLLKMAAGLMTPQSGDIKILGQHINEYKSVPMVFQSYSSFKWMTVIDNVALPMVLKGMDKKQARDIAMETLKLVGLEEHATKYAKSSVLSGGQLQRVSIARCLTSGSKVFFLDEATGALDIKMKREIQDLIIKISSETEHTIINVTHSLEEALYISNKIFILKPNPCTIYKEMDISYGDNQRGRWIFETEEYRNYNHELGMILDEVCK